MRYHWILPCAALAVLAPATTHAQGAPQPAQAENRERARAFADKGYEHFEAGKFEEAIKAFEEAERNFHAPTVLLLLARANVRLGRLGEARGVYRRIIDEALPDGAPPQFVEAQETARKELAEITVDAGTPAPAAPEPAPAAPAPAPAADVAEEKPASKGSIIPAAIAFGVAGIGLGVGAVTGGMTFGKVGELKDNCLEQRCQPSQESTYNSAHTLATVSTVGFVIGGIAAAAGVTLLILRPGGQQDQQVAVTAAPGWINLRGRF